MTRRDIRAFLFDIVEACDLIAAFISERAFPDYLADAMLRSAVERQAIIIGEAMAQIARSWPERLQDFPQHSAIVGFRNHVVHGYFGIDHTQVWDIATVHVPPFRHAVASMLDQLGTEEQS